jgi:hypothetical protein
MLCVVGAEGGKLRGFPLPAAGSTQRVRRVHSSRLAGCCAP